MRRIHFFEFEDLPWFPATVRNGITDFLEYAVVASRLYAPVAPRLERAVRNTGATRIIDLCSGGGGPWKSLLGVLEPLVSKHTVVCLTDLYPNRAAFDELRERGGGRVTYSADPVSAMDVPSDLTGFRTLFSSFHHFRPDQARSILRDAVAKGQPVAIFESTQRHPLLLLYMLMTPLLVMLATPFIRPFRWSRLVWTYLVPVIPLTVMFDGIVSCLRTYTVTELREMADEFQGSGYEWEIGIERIGRLPVGVTYLIGTPGPAATDPPDGGSLSA